MQEFRRFLGFTWFIFAILIGCKNNSSQSNNQASAYENDSLAFLEMHAKDTTQLIETVRHFFGWYAHYLGDTVPRFRFVDTQNVPLKLKQPDFKIFLDSLYATNMVSVNFINDTKEHFEWCAKRWQEEKSKTNAMGLDTDPFFCQARFMPQQYDSVKIVVEDMEYKRASVELKFPNNSINGEYRTVKLRFEGGKWLIYKIKCEEN